MPKPAWVAARLLGPPIFNLRPFGVDSSTMRVSVQVKMLAAFGIVVALMLGVGLFGIARLASDNQHLSRLASKVVPATRAVGDVNALMNKYRKDQLHYIVALPADRPLSAEGSIEGDLAEDLVAHEPATCTSIGRKG